VSGSGKVRRGSFQEEEKWPPEQQAHVPVEDRHQHGQRGQDGEEEDNKAFYKESLSVMR